MVEQPAHERAEILHVRTGQHGPSGDEAFDRILPAGGEETFADDDDVGQRLPGTEFAGGVDEHGVGVRGWNEGRVFPARTPHDPEVEPAEFGQHLRGAFGVAGRDEEFQVGKFFPQPEIHPGQRSLFAGMRAGGEKQRRQPVIPDGPDPAQPRGEIRRPRVGGRGVVIVLQAAGDGEALPRHAQRVPAADIFGIWNEDAVELREDRRDHLPPATVTPLGARREARIDERDRHSPGARMVQ